MSNLAVIETTEVARVEYWADRIRGHLRSSVESVIAAGRDLVEAKAELGDAGIRSVADAVGIDKSTVNYLIRVAENPVLSAHTDALPASVRALGELTRLDPEELEDAIEGGVVHPKLTVKDAQALVRDAGRVIEGALGGDEGETAAERKEPEVRFADKRDEIVFSVTSSVKRLTDALELLKKTPVRADMARDIYAELRKLDTVRAQLIEVIDDEVGTLGIEPPSFTPPKKVITTNVVPAAGNAGLKVNQKDVTLGGVSDHIGDTTLTLEEYNERTGR